MSRQTDIVPWAEANQSLLAAELARLRWRLDQSIAGNELEAGGDSPMPALDAAVADATAAMPAPAAIDRVARVFGLSVFERELLLLCCGVELDSSLAETCARLHGNEARRNASFGLALSTLSHPHWSALTPGRPLRRWHLVDVDAGLRLVDGPLRVDERILHFVAGVNDLDVRLRPLLVEPDAPRLMSDNHARLVDSLVERLESDNRASALVHFDGADDSGQQDIAVAVANRLGHRLFVIEADTLPAGNAELEQLQTLWDRESRLLPAMLLLKKGSATSEHGFASFINRADTSLFVASEEPLQIKRACQTCTVDKPDPAEQRQLWLHALGDTAARLNGSLDSLAGQFRLSAQSIASIVDSVDASETDPHAERGLWQACRRIGRERLEDLADRIEPMAGWDDLVLPEGQLGTLRQVAAHLRQRIRVYEDWGYARQGTRGLGVSALFCGESGTGKTLAAEVLANELKLDLFRIDLSAVVSKYIGETEKNLRRVFDAAEDSGAILLFDEADALFGKRSEVKDSHDRYANIEISYLLQRMEAYRGLAVLTTNMKMSLDRAFQRRLRFVVNFPFPDSGLREAIWRRVFPERMPRNELDYRKLARLNLPGGSIRNIALNAAFLAADADEPVAMGHLLRAAHSESAKLDRPLAEAETRGWT